MGRGVVGTGVLQAGRAGVPGAALNAIWATFSLLIVLAALAVGRETRQVAQPRAGAREPAARRRLADGRVMPGTSRRSVAGRRPADFGTAGRRGRGGRRRTTEIAVGGEEFALPARVVRWDGASMQLQWTPATIMDEARVVQRGVRPRRCLDRLGRATPSTGRWRACGTCWSRSGPVPAARPDRAAAAPGAGQTGGGGGAPASEPGQRQLAARTATAIAARWCWRCWRRAPASGQARRSARAERRR